ncbi:hypothetical protein O3P69_003635 [Scylla paramamosain]|uniref:Uncharacterized protein n=1 Tax=Scylla paramamosain TaxID=85552 RepID=A0AAW0ULA4_SCYPA
MREGCGPRAVTSVPRGCPALNAPRPIFIISRPSASSTPLVSPGGSPRRYREIRHPQLHPLLHLRGSEASLQGTRFGWRVAPCQKGAPWNVIVRCRYPHPPPSPDPGNKISRRYRALQTSEAEVQPEMEPQSAASCWRGSVVSPSLSPRLINGRRAMLHENYRELSDREQRRGCRTERGGPCFTTLTARRYALLPCVSQSPVTVPGARPGDVGRFLPPLPSRMGRVQGPSSFCPFVTLLASTLLHLSSALEMKKNSHPRNAPVRLADPRSSQSLPRLISSRLARGSEIT